MSKGVLGDLSYSKGGSRDFETIPVTFQFSRDFRGISAVLTMF